MTVQRRILDHLESLTAQKNTAVIFITHDLGLAAERAENIVVMHRGKIVESGPAIEILQDPKHPYTQRLVAAAPSLASKRIQSAVHGDKPIEHVAGAAAVGVDLTRRRREVGDHGDADAPPTIEFIDATKVFRIRTGSFSSTQFTRRRQGQLQRAARARRWRWSASPARASRRRPRCCSGSRS